MPGLCYQPDDDNKIVCGCKYCPCKCFGTKYHAKNHVPENAIIFQLPKFKEPRPDTYSHSVYRKEMCSKYLMKQHAALAQKKPTQRPKKPPVFEQERFTCKSLAETDYRKYSSKEASLCKAKFPRTKRKEDFYFRSGEFSSSAKFPQQSVSHTDYCPKTISQHDVRKSAKECLRPPFEGISSYDRDYIAPPLQAYSYCRNARKRVHFD